MIKLRKWTSQWLTVLRLERRRAGRLPWWTMLRALSGGVVPRQIWFDRLSVCRKCPVFDRVNMRCRSLLPGYEDTGCGCHVPTIALTAAPYMTGCWLYEASNGVAGWPAYAWTSTWQRARSVLYFLLGRTY